jgi:hypothetical protein
MPPGELILCCTEIPSENFFQLFAEVSLSLSPQVSWQIFTHWFVQVAHTNEIDFIGVHQPNAIISISVHPHWW